MGICERHWPVVYEFKRFAGGYKRPCNPPSIFGDAPASEKPQTSKSADRCCENRRVTYEERMKATSRIKSEKDKIDNLRDHCRKTGFALESSVLFDLSRYIYTFFKRRPIK